MVKAYERTARDLEHAKTQAQVREILVRDRYIGPDVCRVELFASPQGSFLPRSAKEV